MAGKYRGVTQRGKGWQISFTLPTGERCRETVSFPQTRKGEDEARALRGKVLTELQRGTFDYAACFPRSARALRHSPRPGRHILIKDALREFLKEAEHRCARSTSKDYSDRTYRHLIPEFGDLSLEQLGPDHVREWQRRQSLSNKSINNTLIPLRKVFSRAFEDGIVIQNPMARVRWLPVQSREADPFSREEATKVLLELATRSLEVANYFQFAFATGLRTSELIALTWSDVDLDLRRASITKAKVRGHVKEPKTSSGRRIVDLQAEAIDALESQRAITEGTDEVFLDPTSNEPWKNDQALRKRFWYPSLKAIGIRRRNPYQTRHSYASQQLMKGANPLYVSQQMGHKDWGMIRRVYGRWIHSDGGV